MTAIQAENDAAKREVYENDLADDGQQAENVLIDGIPCFGNLSFDKTEIDLVPGGWNENVLGVFYTLKSYFPNGYPKPKESVLTCTINGRPRNYQVNDLNGDKDNRANLNIGLGAYTNRK